VIPIIPQAIGKIPGGNGLSAGKPYAGLRYSHNHTKDRLLKPYATPKAALWRQANSRRPIQLCAGEKTIMIAL
jgi:hypothetical protein